MAGEGIGGVEEEAVEVAAGVDSKELDEEGLGLDEVVVREEGGEEGEERTEGLGGVVVDIGDVVLSPLEEGEADGRAGS